MAVPQRRKSKAKSRSRRAQTTRTNFTQVAACDNCGHLKPTHRVCPSCGFYAGRLVRNVRYRGD